tara:strand:+ start:913 stop:1140 length:228 start_codon:yes stop_codon:yes gene_type:complete
MVSANPACQHKWLDSAVEWKFEKLVFEQGGSWLVAMQELVILLVLLGVGGLCFGKKALVSDAIDDLYAEREGEIF